MSLSFVSKTVQTSTDDGGYEEKPIEGGSSTEESASRAAHKPLFEQLRANQEQDEAEREEFQRSMMRGTLALDEEDAAHLDAIGKQRIEEEQKVAQQTNQQLAAFRAARADRLERGFSDESNVTESEHRIDTMKIREPRPQASARLIPKITKKRRRTTVSDADNDVLNSEDKKNITRTDPVGDTNKHLEDVKRKPEEEVKGLGGLLDGYDSSSSDE